MICLLKQKRVSPTGGQITTPLYFGITCVIFFRKEISLDARAAIYQFLSPLKQVKKREYCDDACRKKAERNKRKMSGNNEYFLF